MLGIDVCTRMVAKEGKVNVVKVVNRLRDDRGGLVQHDAQLSYLHGAVARFIEG